MGLISKTVKVKWNNRYKKYYESLGYVYTKQGDEFEVMIEHLQKESHTKVMCKCDGCGKKLVWTYNHYSYYARENGETYCRTCGTNLAQKGKAFSKSFHQWCIENNRQDVLDRWDYDLNNCSPRDVTFSTSKRYYFKCNKHPEHKSEIKSITNFTNGQKGSIACNQCNSIAQYILDNFPNKNLYDVWDKDKNGDINPWNISRGSNKKIWLKCQERNYHGSYVVVCKTFTRGCKCPYCTSQKIHKKDSLGQYIIDNYGEEFLWRIWSEKNNKSPFKHSLKSNKKVWWKCLNGGHKDYLRTCNDSFICGFRCPKCVEEMSNSVIEEKTKCYLESIGYCVLTEHSCTIRPINPKTKHPMPYDNEIILHNGKHLIIEVHGRQHYNSNYYKSINRCSKEKAEEMLRKRKLYDRYKKAYAEHYNYHYLELPYSAFEVKNKDLYKQMIDDKIKEILHDTKAS